MATNKIKGITIELNGDSSKLGKALEDVNKESRDLQSELRQVDKMLKFDPTNVELLAQKQDILNSQIDNTSKKLDILKKAEAQVQAQFERGDIGADQYRAFQRELIATEDKLKTYQSTLKKTEDGTEDLTVAVDDLGDEVKDSSGNFTVMKGALADLTSNVIQAGVGAIKDYVSSLFELTEATAEYRSMLTKVEGSANNFGYSVEYAKDRFKEFYTYLKDDQMATNAITNLMGLKVETETLDNLVNGAIATWSAYGDSIPIESLTESMNETIQVSKVTGVMADTINWASLTNKQWTNVLGKGTKAQKAFTKALKDGEAVEDAFSSALAETADTQERANIVAKFLNETYGKSKKTYDELSGSVLDANRAEIELKDTQAELGATLQPLNTEFTRLQTKVLKAMAPSVEEVTDEFIDLLDGIDWNKGAKAIGGLLETGVEGLGFLIDNLEPIGSILAGVGTAWGVYSTAQAGANAITKVTTALTTLQTGATIANKTATEGATLATKALSLAQMATPWGLIAGLIGGAVVAIGTYVAMTNDSTEATNENVVATQELTDKYDDLTRTLDNNKKARQESIEDAEVQGATAEKLSEKIAKLSEVEDKSNGQKALMAEYVSQLNELMPELNLQYDEEKDKLNLTTEAIKEKINANKELMKAQVMQEMLGDILRDQVEAELELARATEQHKTNTEALTEAQAEYDKAFKEWVDEGKPFTNEWSEKLSDLSGKTVSLAEAQKQSGQVVEELTEKVSSLGDEYTDIEETANNIINEQEINAKLTSITEMCKAKGVEIPQAVADGIKAGQYAVPTSVSEMKALITFNDLETKATTSGLKIPSDLAQGIQNGQTKPSEAINQMKNLVTFNDLLEKAKIAGDQVPDQLAQRVASGQLKPQTAVKQMNNLVQFNDLLSKSKLAGFEVPQEIQDAILSGKTKPKDAMKQVNDLVIKTIDSAGASVSTSFAGIMSKGVKAVEGTKGQFTTAGTYVTSGISSGINSGSGSVFSSITSLANNALARFKSALKIQSPSKVFAEEAKFIDEGIASGIDGNKNVAINSMDNLVKDIVDKGKSLSNIEMDDIHTKMLIDSDVPDVDGFNLEKKISISQDTQIVNRLYDMLADYLPRLANMKVVMDTGETVAVLADPINKELGIIKERGRR